MTDVEKREYETEQVEAEWVTLERSLDALN